MEKAKELENASRLLMVLLHSATIAHVLHWKTASYSVHKALGKYYAQIPDLVDTLAESLFGKYSTITDFEDHFMMEYDPLQYMTEIQDYVTSQRKMIAQDSEIQNAVDSIMDLLNTTVYKLRQFSEE
jgi:DNA-binding ferritin-like protein